VKTLILFLRLPARTRAETFGRAKIHTYFKRMIDENKSILLNDAPRGRGEKGVSYLAGFFMLIAFGVGGMLLGGLLGIPVAAAMSGKSVLFITENLSDLAGDKDYLREMQVIQTISAIFGFLIPTLFTASRLSWSPIKLTGFKGAIAGKDLILTIFIIAAGLALSGALGYFTYKLPFPVDWRIAFDRMERNYAETAAGIISLDSVPELFISIIVLALVPAICEEAFFRGGLQNYLYRNTGRLWVSVIVVSVIFSAVHFSVYGFLSRAALGIVLGLIYQYSGRLWLSILAHFINNATAVLVMYVAKSNGKSMQAVLNDKEGSYLGFLAIPVIIFLFIQYRKNTRNSLIAADGI
jgi:membrane protease YdiL (CAAX protease family)